jgi:dTDP-glucose 4,6-dehydratase
MHHVLVTGGAGFIGSNFIHHLMQIEPGCQIINLDALTYAGNLENLNDLLTNKNYSFIRGDICDFDLLQSLFNKYSIDTVVHFAAESHVDRSIIGPMPFIQTNIVGTANLLEAARKYWITDYQLPIDQVRFHHVSTDEVFGSLGTDDPPFSETAPYSPNSPYAASKAASDHLARSFFHTYNLPITITNCSNNYGPFQFPEKLIPLMILNAKAGKPLPIYGDGMQVRDWLYVEDHCEAIYLVLKKGEPGQTYNIGGNNQPPNIEIVKTICNIMDETYPNSPFFPHESLIKYVTDRPGHDRRYAMDISKIHQNLGWQPKESLETGMEKTIRWYLENEKWLAGIQKRNDYGGWIQANYGNR